MGKLLIISGSKSDKPVVDKIEKILQSFDIGYGYEIASAHRNPERLDKLVLETKADIIIAVAGMSAALPGVIASKTLKPVIGVPVSSSLMGVDALLSMTQMPSGIPVATVGIDNGKNAAFLAIEILSLSNEDIKTKLVNYRRKQQDK